MLKQSLIAAVCLLSAARATPTGNHTCTGVVKHEVTVRVNVTEPVTFRAYEWCLRVPPRCSTYTIQLKDRVKIHKEMHNRTITVCCKGYVEIDYKCVPACPPETECPNMHCNRTNHCYCTPGYTGLYCNHPCPKGVWGAGCIKPCDCPPGYTCHHLTGDCMIDDSPPSKTRRTTTAEYLTEAATTIDLTTKPPTTVQTTQPTTTSTSTTTTTESPTTTTTTTQKPTTTTTTTSTTTQRPTTTELVTLPPTTTEPTTTPTEPTSTTTEPTSTTTEPTTTTVQTTTPTTTEPTTKPTTPSTTTTELSSPTPTTTEKATTTQPTSTPSPTIEKTFEETTIPVTSTTEAQTTHLETVTMLPPLTPIQSTEGTEGTTATSTTQRTTVEQISTTTPPTLPSTTIPTTEPPVTAAEKTTYTTTPTTTTTTTTTPTPTTEQALTTTTEPTTEPAPNTTPTTSTTQATVQTTLTTTQLPTTTTTETLPTTLKEIQTEPTIFVAPPIKFDQAVTVQAPVTTERTPATIQTTTTTQRTSTQPTTQPSTSTTEVTTSTSPKTETLPIEEIPRTFTTASPQLEEKRLDGWGKNQFGFDTRIDTKKTMQSVVKIAQTAKPTTVIADLVHERSEKEHTLNKPKVDEEKAESVREVLTSTTDRLDRLIIEDVPKPGPIKPTTDDSPIKLVEEVISKYFPDTFLKPNKALASDKEKLQGKGKLEVPDKSIITPWMKESDKPKTAETTQVLQTEEETKSHPQTDVTTTTIPPPTTPDISTLPIITPKVIVSAKNPDEIDLGGVIYRKMKFFPPAKQPEETTTTPRLTAPSINLHSQTGPQPTTPTEDRFKIYLPEYEKSTEKTDTETTEAPTVRTFLPKFNFDKEDLDYGKQSQQKKAKQKDKEVKKYKIKPNEPTLPPTVAEELENERVTNNVFLETKEFKVHLATTKAAKFGDGYYTKSDQESTDYGKFQKKKPKYGSESDPTKFSKYTVLPESQDSEEGTKEGSFPTTNAKPPHTWYSHVKEKAKIKNAFKIMKSTIGLDLNAKPTEESGLDESNDIHSLATQFTEREPRSAAVTYQEELNNPQMFGQVKFNAPEGFLSWMADDGVKSGIYASIAVGGGCFVAMATLVAVLWLRLKGRTRPRESVSFEDGDVRNPVNLGQPGPSSTVGDYETVYPTASESDEMATFFCPTFTNNYAERINREFKEMSYDHPRSSIAEPLYAEILHPKIKEVDQISATG